LRILTNTKEPCAEEVSGERLFGKNGTSNNVVLEETESWKEVDLISLTANKEDPDNQIRCP
jgi:hypothetical protein